MKTYFAMFLINPISLISEMILRLVVMAENKYHQIKVLPSAVFFVMFGSKFGKIKKLI